MRVEIPELKRCCCCLPLRRGLLIWIYMQLAIGLILLTFSIFAEVYLGDSDPHLFLPIAMIVFMTDIVFCVLFIVSAHRKIYKSMRVYYIYAIVILLIEGIALVGFVVVDIYTTVGETHRTLYLHQLEYVCPLFVEIVLQAYLVILVRSEVLKLERSAKIEFINRTNDPECKAQLI